MKPGSQNSAAVARLQILAAAALFSSGGAVIKSCGLDAMEVAFGRSAIAAIMLILVLRGARTGWNRSIVPVSVSYAATMLLFVSANKFTTAASTVFLQATSPLYVLLAGPWLLGERIGKRDLVLMSAFGLGLMAFFLGAAPPVSTAPNPLLGNILATISGMTWAGIVIGLRFLSARPDSDPDAASTAIASGNLLACVVALPWAKGLLEASPDDWMLLIYLGVFQIAGAYFLLVKGVRSISAFNASLLLLLEPVLAPIWAWSLHGETLSGMTFLGGGIILVASIAQQALPEEPIPVPRVSLTPDTEPPADGDEEASTP